MSPAGSDDGREGLMRTVLEDPETGRERIPELLSLLDADERATRLAACWAVTLVVDANPATAEPVARRLLGRLADGETSLELSHAFSYLRHRFPDTVDEALLTAAEEADGRSQRRRYLEVSREFARSDYDDAGPGDPPVGRTRGPGRTGPTDSRR